MVHSFRDDEDRLFEVYKCTESTPGFRYIYFYLFLSISVWTNNGIPFCRDYHDRLQAWIMFYIGKQSQSPCWTYI